MADIVRNTNIDKKCRRLRTTEVQDKHNKTREWQNMHHSNKVSKAAREGTTRWHGNKVRKATGEGTTR
jgi:hypothetical protein